MSGMRVGLLGLRVGLVLAALSTANAARATTPRGWTLQSTLTRMGSPMDAGFGRAVSVSGTSLLVGNDAESSNGFDSNGAVYFYSGSGWSQVTRLVASDDRDYAGIGASVALGADSAFAGNGRIDNATVYAFGRVSGAWAQTQVLKEDASSTFGWSMVVQGDRVAIAAPKDSGDTGKVHMYGKSNGMWSEEQELTASDAAPGSFFGLGMDFDGETLAIGAPGNLLSAAAPARVYVFEKLGPRFVERAKITLTDGLPARYAGSAISISGDTLLVGATPGIDMKNNGEVRVYQSSEGNWKITQTLSMQSEDTFGATLHLERSTAWILGHTGDAGTVYVYELGPAGFELQKALPLAGKAGSAALSVNGTNLAVGVPNDGSNGSVQVYNNPDQGRVFEDESGCSIATRGRGPASLLLIGGCAIAYVLRRRRRMLVGSGTVIAK